MLLPWMCTGDHPAGDSEQPGSYTGKTKPVKTEIDWVPKLAHC